MNKEAIKNISETAIRLKFLMGKQFMKPLREIERKSSDLTPGHVHIMRWMLSKGPAPASMTDLAVVACISKPNLTTMIDRLCQEGFVERSADDHDRRVVNVALTQAGIDFLHKHNADVNAMIEARLSLLEDPELEKLQNVMNDFVDILKVMAEKEKEQEKIK